MPSLWALIKNIPDETDYYADLDVRIDFEKAPLPDRDKQIVAMRFGLFGWREHERTEMVAYFHVTPARIRQIEEKALAKLKRYFDIQPLVLPSAYHRKPHHDDPAGS